MNTNNSLKNYFILLLSFVLFSSNLLFATEAEENLKNQIYETYGITVYDNDATNGLSWSEDYLNAMIQVFQDMPESFLSATRMVYIAPGQEQFEIKYNGYNEEYGIIQFGMEAFSPSSAYLTQFKKVYKTTPSATDKINRFKTMLVRGLAYSFIQQHSDAFGKSDLIQSYQSVYADNASFSTRLFSFGDENYMVVAPGKNHLWTDLAFAAAQYCTNASGLKKNYAKRYQFVRENLFDDTGVAGWPESYLDGTGKTSGGDGHNGSNTNTNTNTSTTTTLV